MSTQIQLAEIKPTSQEIEQALINIIKAGLYYRRPKDGKFMQNYKERVKKLRQAEDPEEYILKLAQTIFPNKDKYHQIMDDYKSYYGKDPKILNSIMELYGPFAIEKGITARKNKIYIYMPNMILRLKYVQK